MRFFVCLECYFFAAMLYVSGVGLCQEDLKYRNISARDALQRIESSDSLVILDVRTKAEFEGNLGHLDNALLIPLHELKERIHELEKFKESEILVYCRSGRRSARACEILSAEGFQVTNLLGGISKLRERERDLKQE